MTSYQMHGSQLMSSFSLQFHPLEAEKCLHRSQSCYDIQLWIIPRRQPATQYQQWTLKSGFQMIWNNGMIERSKSLIQKQFSMWCNAFYIKSCYVTCDAKHPHCKCAESTACLQLHCPGDIWPRKWTLKSLFWLQNRLGCFERKAALKYAC